MKGYKVFNPDFTCLGFQYKENETFIYDGKIQLCEAGFHFCGKASDCFNYYEFNSENIVCEVEAFGEIIKSNDDDSKMVTDKLKVGRRLNWHEVLDMLNTGENNTGLRNSGNYNSGNWNSGHRNPGNSNSGHRNSGNYNSGDWNSGHRNSGNYNSGNWNSGHRNSGNANSGNYNSGTYNSGDWNSGNSNSGNWNSGNWNSGNSNSGNYNSGEYNSGNYNSGEYNSGNYNSGDCNSGYINSGNYNSGAFCTDENPVIWLFDKPTDIKVKDWMSSEAMNILRRKFYLTEWIYEYRMSNEEKKDNPTYKTTGGYLKTRTMHEAWEEMWGKLSDDKKKVFLTLPNFDAGKFEVITGIKIQRRNKMKKGRIK